MITRKAAPALAAGCPIITKPAKLTPFFALAMGELVALVGISSSVLNVITGSESGRIGTELTESLIVRKVTFTDLTGIDEMLMQQCAHTVMKVYLGNAPPIVFDDVNIDRVVEVVIICKFRNACQTCVCANEIFMQDGVYAEFARKFTAATAAMPIGNGFDQGIVIGPMVEALAHDKAEEHVQDVIAKDAKVATGGVRHGAGSFFVLSDATCYMAIFEEELFE
jgi:succinate-semialdehyde dehydrogenase/glutarate-semialdehyde dehydrogenase